MTKSVYLLLSAAVLSCIAGCAGAPTSVDTGNADAQRSRAEKAQNELDVNVSRQKADGEKR